MTRDEAVKKSYEELYGKAAVCSSCGERPREGGVLCAECIGANMDMPQDRYIAALRRLRHLIAVGTPLASEDSCVIGDKYTRCSWGLCSDTIEAWPDPEDHLWPHQFKTEGRVAPKHRRDKQFCPLSRTHEAMGCFYECRVFSAGSKPFRESLEGPLSRHKALELYDSAIALAEAHRIEVDYTAETGGKCSCGADGYVCTQCKRALCSLLVYSQGGVCSDCCAEATND